MLPARSLVWFLQGKEQTKGHSFYFFVRRLLGCVIMMGVSKLLMEFVIIMVFYEIKNKNRSKIAVCLLEIRRMLNRKF